MKNVILSCKATKKAFQSKYLQRGNSNLIQNMDKCGFMKGFSATIFYKNNTELFQRNLTFLEAFPKAFSELFPETFPKTFPETFPEAFHEALTEAFPNKFF